MPFPTSFPPVLKELPFMQVAVGGKRIRSRVIISEIDEYPMYVSTGSFEVLIIALVRFLKFIYRHCRQ